MAYDRANEDFDISEIPTEIDDDAMLEIAHDYYDWISLRTLIYMIYTSNIKGLLNE